MAAAGAGRRLGAGDKFPEREAHGGGPRGGGAEAGSGGELGDPPRADRRVRLLAPGRCARLRLHLHLPVPVPLPLALPLPARPAGVCPPVCPFNLRCSWREAKTQTRPKQDLCPQQLQKHHSVVKTSGSGGTASLSWSSGSETSNYEKNQSLERLRKLSNFIQPKCDPWEKLAK
ncbi:hypothetical protein VULLAG_LOCUS21484 [Vulpes lagopus]